MNRILINTFCALLLITTAHAQSVGIGTTQPDASAALDVKSDNKGLLIPRVDLATVTAPANGLIAFNTNGGIFNGPGLYINMGTNITPQWELVASSQSGSFIRNQTNKQLNSNFHISGNGNIEEYLKIGDSSSQAYPLRIISNNSGLTGIALSNRSSGGFWSIQVNGSDRLPGAFSLVDNVSGNTALVSTDNRVGINMSTQPTATLDVNGDIKAQGYFLLDVQTLRNVYTLPGNSRGVFTKSCPSGYRLIAGGGGHRDANSALEDIVMAYNGPDPDFPTVRWRIMVQNTSSSSRAIILFCTCAKVK